MKQMENVIETAILQHGFAIAVAAWLMLRVDKHLEEIRDALQRLEHMKEKKRRS